MRWTAKPQPNPEKVEQLAQSLMVSKPIAMLLVQRGIETFEEAKAFFRPELKALHDPFLMKDMDKAIDRLNSALEKNESILVYGDYDVDGTTSVALMTTYLQGLTDKVSSYIPDRYAEGYGISFKGIDYAAENDFSLVIALDCGIKAVEKMNYAKSKGVDFIICDHHRPGAEIPTAVAVLDPKRADCAYPFKELCGCGVGFKLIQAHTKYRGEKFETLVPYLDLVATATGADIVPIVGENRILAYHGLQVINTKPRPGFKAIIDAFEKSELTITDVVFGIAPRINAAGRMEHALRAVELLMAKTPEGAHDLVPGVEQNNANRKETDHEITEEALRQIKTLGEEDRQTTVVYDEHWHKGVIGIVASRLIETYYRPTLVFTKSGDKLAASARSVKGFDVYNALEACSDYIEQFGGHKYAAGLTLREDQYEGFKQKFEEVVSRTITPEQLRPEVLIDMQLDFDQITPKFWRILKQFAPFGPGNMQPVFLARGLTDTGYAKQMGKAQEHLRCNLRQNGGRRFLSAIGFGLGDKFELLKTAQNLSAVYSIDENVWNNKVSLQLKLCDFR